ncbi:MAG: hypothetical protein EWM73_03263 [Nitrospira sp.]|nr:MAG: hypothetical protein EWM73_03263 [Nitrospira sp.]
MPSGTDSFSTRIARHIFMVMERSHDPDTHEVRYAVNRVLPGGKTDPAGIEIDLWVRSKETHNHNFSPVETFLHFY